MRGWSSGAGSKAKGSDCSQALGQGSRSPSLEGHEPPRAAAQGMAGSGEFWPQRVPERGWRKPSSPSSELTITVIQTQQKTKETFTN